MLRLGIGDLSHRRYSGTVRPKRRSTTSQRRKCFVVDKQSNAVKNSIHSIDSSICYIPLIIIIIVINNLFMSSSTNNNNNNRRSSNRNNNNNNDEVTAVVRQITVLARAAGHRHHTADRSRIRRLLEATGAGQAELAAQLYWDDFLASSLTAGSGGMNNNSNNNDDNAAAQEDNNDNTMNLEDDEEDDSDEMEEMEEIQYPPPVAAPPRRTSRNRHNNNRKKSLTRQRLQQRLEAHAPPAKQKKADSEDDDDNVKGMAVVQTARRRLIPQKRAADPAVQRLVAQAKATMQQVAREAPEKLHVTTAAGNTSSTHHGSKNKSKACSGALPADDWVWAAVDQEREKIPPTSPSAVLWGTSSSEKGAAVVTRQDDQASDSNSISSNNNNNNNDEDADSEKEVALPSAAADAVIPLEWLRVGMTLDDETAMGLVLPKPTAADNGLAFDAWQQVALKRQKKNQQPPPFYCRAATAVLSIITALLHAGVQVEDAAAVSSGSGGSTLLRIRTQAYETPWTTLSKQERQQQFDVRLTQALTCLFYRAAVVARTRRLQALQQGDHDDDDDDVNAAARQRVRRQAARRKVQRICPVLGWPSGTTAADGTAAEPAVHVPTAEQPTTFSTSFTNIQDLHLYTASQLTHFQKPGGVALLLETLVQMHGPATLAQLLAASSGNGTASSSPSSLICCTCAQRDEAAHKPHIGKKDTTQQNEPKADCCGVELVSLLLTGSIHSTWQDWSTDPLGIGILSDQAVLSKTLTRPLLPLWILVGPTVYSVLWADPKQPDESQQQRQQQGPAVVRLEHWNAWYQNRTGTQLRLSMGRHDWKPPPSTAEANPMEVDADDEYFCHSYTLRILEERRRKRCRIAEERQGLEVVDPNAVFTAAQRAQVRPHPDDVRLYPENYTLWRYDGTVWPQGDGHDNQDAKPRSRWIPYHRLTAREQRLVQGSLGPAICNILRTRWPTSTLDALEPARPFPIV